MILHEWLLGGALLTSAVYAGVYFGFAVGVMPGLHPTGDGTYVETMREINKAIVNPAFMLAFLGAPALTVAASLGQPGQDRVWLLAAIGLHVATIVITVAASIPLNDALAAAHRGAAGPAVAREAFEGPWVIWNVARTLTATGAAACLVPVAMS